MAQNSLEGAGADFLLEGVVDLKRARKNSTQFFFFCGFTPEIKTASCKTCVTSPNAHDHNTILGYNLMKKP